MTRTRAQHSYAADNLMLTGITYYCTDCAGERIFVTPECGDDDADDADCADYACTDCGAAVIVGLEVTWQPSRGQSRVA